MKIFFTKTAWSQYEYWNDIENNKIVEKINLIIKSLLACKNNSIGDKLPYMEHHNLYQAEIDYDNMLVYRFANNQLEIIACKGKYDSFQKIKNFAENNVNIPETNVGYVYIMRCMSFYKIGRCNLSKKRLGEYTLLPQEPEYVILRIVKNNKIVEKELHKMFAEKRLRNGSCEWFDLTQEDINKAIDYVDQFEFKII